MNEYRNMLKQGYQEDLQDCTARAAQGQCAPWRQAYCFGEIAAAKGTDAYPDNGDALLAELRRLVDTVPQVTDRAESAAELAAQGGELLFHSEHGGALVELAALPGGKFDGWAYLGERESAGTIAAELKAWAEANPDTAAKAADTLAGMYRELDV